MEHDVSIVNNLYRNTYPIAARAEVAHAGNACEPPDDDEGEDRAQSTIYSFFNGAATVVVTIEVKDIVNIRVPVVDVLCSVVQPVVGCIR